MVLPVRGVHFAVEGGDSGEYGGLGHDLFFMGLSLPVMSPVDLAIFSSVEYTMALPRSYRTVGAVQHVFIVAASGASRVTGRVGNRDFSASFICSGTFAIRRWRCVHREYVDVKFVAELFCVFMGGWRLASGAMDPLLGVYEVNLAVIAVEESISIQIFAEHPSMPRCVYGNSSCVVLIPVLHFVMRRCLRQVVTQLCKACWPCSNMLRFARHGISVRLRGYCAVHPVA